MSAKGIAECFIWHLLCGGPVVVVHRLVMAIISIIFCQTNHAKEHLKVARFALYPSGKRLEYSTQKFMFFEDFHYREPLTVLSCLVWGFQIISAFILQPVFSALTLVLTLRTLSKHWDSIWRVSRMTFDVDIVEESWTPPLPRSESNYDPSSICKISLQSARGRWVVAERGDAPAVHCHQLQLRLIQQRGVLVSHPKDGGKVALELHGGKWLSVGAVWRWLWHCRKSTASAAECTETECFAVETVSDGVIGLKSAAGEYLSAPSDYTLQWTAISELTDSEKFTVIVHGEDTVSLEHPAAASKAAADSKPGPLKRKRSGIIDALGVVGMEDIGSGSDDEAEEL